MDGIAARRSQSSGSLRSRDDELTAVGRVRAARRFHRSGYFARGAQLRSLITCHTPSAIFHMADGVWHVAYGCQMYFNNLPIKFDARGHASLRGDVQSSPFATRNGAVSHTGAETQRAVESLVARPGLCSFDIDPIVRISGALDFHGVIDFDRRKSLDARASASLFRGEE